MYLSLLKSDDIKLAFLEMAYFVSIADVKKDNEEYVEENQRPLMAFAFRPASRLKTAQNADKIKSVMARKDPEKKMLRLYAEEMNLFSKDDNSQSEARVEMELADLVDNALDRFLTASQTTNEKILNSQEFRIEFIKDSLNLIADENSEQLAFATPEEKKAIIFELVGMSYSDGNVSPAEHAVVAHACNLLDVDQEFIDETEEVVVGMVTLQKQGYELIQE